MRTAPAETLALFPEPLPPAPRELAGFSRDDQVWLFDGDRRTAARVIAVLRSTHQIVVRTVDHRIETITPAAERGRLLKRNLEP